MADCKNVTRIEIGTDRRSPSSDEIQELSKKEMENVQGGALNLSRDGRKTRFGGSLKFGFGVDEDDPIT